jgi:glycosyltransferase involved in cell wall biosynthesis
LKILLTNHTLAHRTGSELYVLELATKLLARGLSPIAFSPLLGGLAAEFQAAGIPLVDDLTAVDTPPDIIHGQHHAETMTALLHFPGVPAIYVCHGARPWEEVPPRFPRLLRYVAVDQTVYERMTGDWGIPPERIETLLNFVDLERFRPRGPLPVRPGRALVFSNNASESTHLPVIREACARQGVAVDVAGIASGAPSTRPEEILPAYDLVFAKGRAALEAMAVGAAVVLCDAEGSGPLVTAAELDGLRPRNFGFFTLRQPVTAEVLAAQIERYDPADAAEVSHRIRAIAGIEKAVDRYVEIYEQVLAESRARGPVPPGDESRAAAAYLRWLNPALKERARALIDRDVLWRRVHALEGRLDPPSS